MALEYYVVDVFTNAQFGGNPLAVVLGADELSSEQMQLIAREFNFSETSFVCRPKDVENTAHVRIFTATYEMPFAGHPNVGTSWLLAKLANDKIHEMRFEEKAGLVRVKISYDADTPSATSITAPLALSIEQEFSATEVVKCLTLTAADIATSNHMPLIAGVGANFTIIELANKDALKNISVDAAAANKLVGDSTGCAFYLYVRNQEADLDWRARMFTFRGGLFEDPATGSAGGAAAALQHHLGIKPKHSDNYQIVQGVEMGRKSNMFIKMIETEVGPRAEISGASVMVMKGELLI